MREPTACDLGGSRLPAPDMVLWCLGQTVLGRQRGRKSFWTAPLVGGHPCQGDAISLHYWFAVCLSRSHDDNSGLNLETLTSHLLLLMDAPISS